MPIPRFDGRAKLKAFHAPGTRLTGQRWTDLRNAYLRMNPACETCGRPGEEVHHVIPRQQRPDLVYDRNNLRTLCKSCHLAVHGFGPDANRKPRF